LDRLSVLSLAAYRKTRLAQPVEIGIDTKRTRMVGEATISRELAALRAVTNWAMAERLPIGKEGSVFDCLSKGNRRVIFPRERPSAEPSRITNAELDTVVAHLPAYAKAIPLIAVRTGLRLQEVIGMTWSQVDLRSTPPSVRPTKTKSGRARVVPLCPSAVALLPKRHAAGGVVFRGPLSDKMLANFPRSWNIARVKAGFPRMRFHDLRHEWASRYCEAGGDLRSLQAIGGWSSLNLVERYSRANLVRAVDVIEKAACQ
jgi:integrase